MNLKESIESVRNNFRTDSDPFPRDSKSIESLYIKYLGRKGIVADLFNQLKDVSNKDRPEIGKSLNQLKNEISKSFSSVVNDSSELDNIQEDLTLPGLKFPTGRIHPLQQTMNDIKSIFMNVGFSIAYGPEVDDDFHNFGALNFPPEHPARDMQDTFFIDSDTMLRTHTSNVQIHLMENHMLIQILH